MDPHSEVQRVSRILLGRIIDGTYPKGLRLPAEASLAEELTCGRSTIREALRHVADLGLVKSRRGSGALLERSPSRGGGAPNWASGVALPAGIRYEVRHKQTDELVASEVRPSHTTHCCCWCHTWKGMPTWLGLGLGLGLRLGLGLG